MGNTESAAKSPPREIEPRTEMERRLRRVLELKRSQILAAGSSKSLNVNKFNRICLQFPTVGKTFKEVRMAFDEYDRDHNGTIEYSELRDAMKQLGLRLHEEEIRAIFHEADFTHEQHLSFRQFLLCLALGYLLRIIPGSTSVALSASLGEPPDRKTVEMVARERALSAASAGTPPGGGEVVTDANEGEEGSDAVGGAEEKKRVEAGEEEEHASGPRHPEPTDAGDEDAERKAADREGGAAGKREDGGEAGKGRGPGDGVLSAESKRESFRKRRLSDASFRLMNSLHFKGDLARAFDMVLEAYVLFDQECRGYITRKELRTALKKMQGQSPSRKFVRSGMHSPAFGDSSSFLLQERFKELDFNHDNHISFTEFLYTFESWCGVDEELESSDDETVIRAPQIIVKSASMIDTTTSATAARRDGRKEGEHKR